MRINMSEAPLIGLAEASTFNVPTINSVDNTTISDVIGNKTDNEAGTSVMSALYVLMKHNHSAMKVYPTLASPTQINKVSTAAWGVDANPTQIIPANTIADPFDIHFINFGSISANDQYELILFQGAPGAETEIARAAFDRNTTFSEGTAPVQTPMLAANTRVSAKLTSGAASARNVSVKLSYHIY
jgi:hypothetical protein